jgi:hypothetical protein
VSADASTTAISDYRAPGDLDISTCFAAGIAIAGTDNRRRIIKALGVGSYDAAVDGDLASVAAAANNRCIMWVWTSASADARATRIGRLVVTFRENAAGIHNAAVDSDLATVTTLTASADARPSDTGGSHITAVDGDFAAVAPNTASDSNLAIISTSPPKFNIFQNNQIAESLAENSPVPIYASKSSTSSAHTLPMMLGSEHTMFVSKVITGTGPPTSSLHIFRTAKIASIDIS